MHFLGAALVQEVHRLVQLRAAHDGVVHEQQLLLVDELGDVDLLHLRHAVAHFLVARHERARPCGRVLDEGAGEGGLALRRVADGVRHARVGHAGHVVELGHAARRGFVAGHDGAVAIAHDLDVHALVVRVRVAVVHPQEGADLHLVACGGDGAVLVGVHQHDLAGAKLVFVAITQLVVGERLERDAEPVIALADEHRQAAHLVARGDDLAVLRDDEQRERSVDGFLRVLDARDEVVLLVDERGDELRGVHLARAHGHELAAAAGEVALHQLLGVVDGAHRGDAERAQVRAHQQRLRVGVADAADAAATVEALQVVFEARAERRVLDRVDLALEASFLRVVENHARALRSQVGVVVHAEEHVQHHVVMRRRPKESAHCLPFVVPAANPCQQNQYTATAGPKER